MKQHLFSTLYHRCGALLVAVMLLLAGSTTVLATNGYFRHGYGLQYRGLAGAGTALYLSPMAAAHNPASIGFIGSQLDIGFSLFNPDREYTVTGTPSGNPFTFPLTPGTVESESKMFIIPELGLSYDLGGGNVLGFAFYGNGGMNTDYATKTFDNPQLAFDAPTGVDLSQLFIAATYARKLGPNHSLGITGIYVYQRFKAEGLPAFGGFSSDPARLTNNDYASSTGFGLRIGYLGEFAGVFSIGTSFQTKMSMSEFDDYAGLFAEGGDFDIPANWTAGIAFKVTPALTLVADVQQVLYGDIASISNPMDLTANPPFVPDTGNPGNLMPNPGFIPLGLHDAWGFGWEDMTIVKFGVQMEAAPGLMLRGGYSYGKQPIPGEEVLFNILAPGVIEQHLTLGLTKSLTATVDLNVAFMHGLSNTVSGDNRFEVPGQQQIELKMNQFEGDFGVSIRL